MARDLCSLVSILSYHSEHNPSKLACILLEDQPKKQYNYSELHNKALTIAAYLQQHHAKNERVLILLPQGLDYLAVFFGCLYAGAIAVPAYQPVNTNHALRVKAIAQDAQPKYIFADANIISILIESDWCSYNKNLVLIDIDQIDARCVDKYYSQKFENDDIAFLQYSSGSTGNPKGIVISHGNIMANLQMMQKAFKQDQTSIIVSWVPLFHDMGLSISSLLPLFLGATIYLMSPFTFLKKPVRWLRAISNYKGTLSPAPDFAYKMCVKGVSNEEKSELDLSCWQIALTGSEPIRKDTLEEFSTAFKGCGFNKRAFYPAYGLAEVTVFATGNMPGGEPIYYYADSQQLQKRVVSSTEESSTNCRALVGCGIPWLDEKIFIVDPNTLKECASKEIGEIMIGGPHVAKGYWDKAELSQQTFHVYTNNGNGPLLRTGDLGFFDENTNLYITGRIKDVIIIHGKNHAAHDIEETVAKAHVSILENPVVVFSIDENNEEKLVIIIGIKKISGLNFNEIIKSIKQSIYARHDILPSEILFVDKSVITKTTSGKIQRQLVKKNYLLKNLDVIDLISVSCAL